MYNEADEVKSSTLPANSLPSIPGTMKLYQLKMPGNQTPGTITCCCQLLLCKSALFVSVQRCSHFQLCLQQSEISNFIELRHASHSFSMRMLRKSIILIGRIYLKLREELLFQISGYASLGLAVSSWAKKSLFSLCLNERKKSGSGTLMGLEERTWTSVTKMWGSVDPHYWQSNMVARRLPFGM